MEEFDLGFKSVGMPRRKVPWYAPFVGWVCWLFVIALTAAFIFIVSMAVVNTVHAEPIEPPPETAIEWEAHRSLGIIIRYEVDGLSIWFSHPVQQSRVAEECTPIHVEGGIMYLTTTSDTPMQYEASAEATGYKWSGEPFWTPLIQKSWCGGCE